jgi:hypothetical protein
VIDMDESQIRTLDQVRAFLDGTLAVEFYRATLCTIDGVRRAQIRI